MENEEYLQETCEKFNDLIGQWFKNERIITLERFDAIKFRLEDLTELGEDATLDFEKGFHIEKFSKVLQHGPRLGLGVSPSWFKTWAVFNARPMTSSMAFHE
ncbi:MAG: hypothetical protein KKE23_01630 [Nanoarchaeota archaeon]|nr:hypothetical protein [Nanoarchaeota archaeon]